MEGTKNERTIVIISSYIIGFVTGFILFNTTQTEVTLPQNTSNVVSTQKIEQVIITDLANDYMLKPNALKSVDGKNIFYCETIDELDDYCYAYIYGIEADTVNAVLVDGEPLTIKNEAVEKVKWTNEGLIISGIKSSNLTEPWLLTNPETPIDLE
jgi:hypothetical protein